MHVCTMIRSILHSYHKAVVFKRPAFLSKTLIKTLYTHIMHSNHDGATMMSRHIGMMRGPMAKIAQLTSMIPDFVPEPYRQQLRQLCTQTYPMPWSVARRCLSAELGTNWDTRFDHFNPVPVATASIGQVHKVRLHDGRYGACKIQYPDIRLSMQSDLNTIGWALRFLEKWSKAIKTQSIFDELCTRMIQELDYTQEARHMDAFYTFFHNDADLCIPKPVHHLSGKTVLTMEWVNGHAIDTVRHEPECVRNRVARQLLKGWYAPFFQQGMMHGDPHQGNMAWTDTHVIMMDWGCARHFSPDFVHSIVTLYNATLHNQPDTRHQVYASWSIPGLNKDICHGLDLWTGFLMAPFIHKEPCYVDDISSSKKGQQVAKHVRHLFHQGGGVVLPAEFLIFDRVAVVLGSILTAIKAKACWADLFQSIMMDANTRTS